MSQAVARKIRHLVAIRNEMNKMAEGDEFRLSQRNIRVSGETLEHFVSGVSQDEMTGFELSEAFILDR